MRHALCIRQMGTGKKRGTGKIEEQQAACGGECFGGEYVEYEGIEDKLVL